MPESASLDVIAAAARLGVRPDALIARWDRLRLAGVGFSASTQRRLEVTEHDLATLADAPERGAPA